MPKCNAQISSEYYIVDNSTFYPGYMRLCKETCHDMSIYLASPLWLSDHHASMCYGRQHANSYQSQSFHTCRYVVGSVNYGMEHLLRRGDDGLQLTVVSRVTRCRFKCCLSTICPTDNASLEPIGCGQHGQQTGAFSWCPVMRFSQLDRPIPTRPFPELCTWKAVRSRVVVT